MSFQQWLESQQTREDAISALAIQLLNDPISPLWSNRLNTYYSFLIYRDEESNFTALTTAFAEWQHANDSSTPQPKQTQH